ncbi:hypothetical protein FOA43_002654 [Brettanomyces nanus]|uniref:C2H2-type domain-containing protein n=1 Tax=Eeniella nana TaxID=13502 RepID=A0A875S321_EENNA|nr:uncharacterized protein FOA43_002654 [Brettanomyces nanus]QPG75303.1 hypothetical protein FOA43_002654 [Brettanomyces nanus]
MRDKKQAVVSRFKCPFPNCSKFFKRRDYLQRHEANHAAVRPFRCELCGISFSRKDLVRKHKTSKSHRKQVESLQNPSSPIFVNTFLDAKVFKNTRTSNKRARFKVNKDEKGRPAGVQHDSAVLGLERLNFTNLVNFEDSYGWLFDGSDSSSTIQDDEYSGGTAMVHSGQLSPENTNTLDSEAHCWDVSLPPVLQQHAVELITQILVDDSLSMTSKLRTSKINTYFAHYYKYFDTTCPIVHRQIFTSGNADDNLLALLVVAVLTIGMSFTDGGTQKYSEEYMLAIEIHRKLRTALFVEIEKYQNINDISLELLLTLELTDFFNIYMGSGSQSRSANIFHPMVMSLFQELDLYLNVEEPNIESNEEVSRDKWISWIRYESLKRVAYFAYLMDAQRTFFYSKNPCMSIFEIQLELPYTDRAWYAPDPAEFMLYYSKQPRGLFSRNRKLPDDHTPYVIGTRDLTTNGLLIPNVKSEGKWPNFLWSLRRLMQSYSKNQKEYHTDCFSQFSRYILLHGVLSLIRELRNLSILDLGNQKSRLSTMAAKIEQSLFNWKGYLNKHIADMNASSLDGKLPLGQMNDYGTSPSFWSNVIMFKTGLLGLYCDFDLLFKYRSSIRKLEGQGGGCNGTFAEIFSPERTKFYELGMAKSEMMVRSWACSKSGLHSNIEACNILRMIFYNEELLSSLPHAPFSMYISVLTCWFYQHNGSLSPSGSDMPVNSPELDIVTQGDEIRKKALEYISYTLDEVSVEMAYQEGPAQVSISTPAAQTGNEKLLLVKALVLHSIVVLERSSRWANSNSTIDDLCSLLNVKP